MLMGSGKSAVVMPLLLVRLANNSHESVRIVQPPHLVKAAERIVISAVHPVLRENSGRIVIISDKGAKLELYREIALSWRYTRGALGPAKYLTVHSQNTDMKSEPKFTIYDEFDTMINPLRSNVQIPFRRPQKGGEVQWDDVYYVTPADLSRPLEVKPIWLAAVFKVFINNVMGVELDARTGLEPRFQIELGQIERRIQYLLSHVNTLRINQHFGFPTKDTKFSRNLAVPYYMANQPMNESKFMSQDLTIILTIKTYQKTGLRDSTSNVFIW